jgi:hypothetical protein
MYQTIFRSYVRFEQARGFSFEVARSRGVSAFTLFALLDVVAVTFLIQLSGGPRISDWVTEHAWAIGVVTIALLGFHWALGRTIPQPSEAQPRTNTDGTPVATKKFLLAWYIGATLLLWVFACVIVIVHLMPPH